MAMLAILCAIGMFVADQSRSRLEAENLFLRHQLNIVLRCVPPRVRLRGFDRPLLVSMTRVWPSLLGMTQVVQPEAIVCAENLIRIARLPELRNLSGSCSLCAASSRPFWPRHSSRRAGLKAEIAALRHELIVLRRKVDGRVRLTKSDRRFLIQLYRWFPSILQVLTIVQPDTLVWWHRAGFRLLLALEVASGGRASAD